MKEENEYVKNIDELVKITNNYTGFVGKTITDIVIDVDDSEKLNYLDSINKLMEITNKYTNLVDKLINEVIKK